MEIPYWLSTTVVDLSRQGDSLFVTCVSRERGLQVVGREPWSCQAPGTPRGALNIPELACWHFLCRHCPAIGEPGSYLPGREVVILGSGDIGLIMARRMTLEGAVQMRRRADALLRRFEAEHCPVPGRLRHSPKLSHTVIDIQGKERVTGVTIAQVDERMKPIPGTEEQIPCDTLLLSVGLIPENELSKAVGVELSPVTNGPKVNESLETSIPGVFACGNVLHVHDLVDYVSEEAEQAGRHAAAFVVAGGKEQAALELPVKPEGAARYTVPVAISPSGWKKTWSSGSGWDGISEKAW